MRSCISFEFNDNAFIIIAICYGVVGLMVVISNSIIFVAMIKDPLKKLRTTFNYLVVNLCICDLLNGFVSIPLLLVEFRFDESQRETILNPKTLICYILPNIISVAVFFSMCAVSIDRYKAIVHPIKYRQNISWRRCIKYTLSIWLLAILSSSLLLINNVIVTVAWMNIIIVTLATLLLIVYFRLKKSLRSHNAEFEERMKESLTASPEVIKNRLKTEQKIMRVYSVILITVLITTIPGLVIFNIIGLYHVDCLFGFVVQTIRILLLFSNSVINPLVCIFMLKDFKESIKLMFCCGS